VSYAKRLGRGAVTFAPFTVKSSRLKPGGAGGGMLPIDFAGDFQVELFAGLKEDLQGGAIGLMQAGFASTDGDVVAAIDQMCQLETTVGGKAGPGAKKDLGKIGPGSQFTSTLDLKGDKLSVSLNGDATAPVAFSTKKPMRFFLLFAITPDWYIERLIIRGTATGESMSAMAHVLAEKQAAALFAE